MSQRSPSIAFDELEVEVLSVRLKKMSDEQLVRW
jgi:hypothetical protein